MPLWSDKILKGGLDSTLGSPNRACVAQLVERGTFNSVVVGSSPITGMPFRVAQWVEHRISNPKVVGSTPTTEQSSRSSVGQSGCLINNWPRVQVPPGTLIFISLFR